LGWVQSVYGLAAKGALNLHALRLREARSASCLDSNSSTAAWNTWDRRGCPKVSSRCGCSTHWG